MYNKIIKKYYLLKIFVISQPKNTTISNKACFVFCKYFLKQTAYGNINFFIKELKNILNIFLYKSKQNKLLFICSHKIFSLNINNNLKFKNINLLKKKNILKKNVLKKTNFIIWYNMYNFTKIIAIFKNQKIPSIGFINFYNQPNLSDYTLLLESRFFSSIFIFHFLLKKLVIK